MDKGGAAPGFFAWLLTPVAALVLLAYSPALSGTYHFDDAVNLAGLQQVKDGGDWCWFVLSGQNPPFGRALALLSFVPQAAAWPAHPAAFLLVNFLIHAANVVLAGVFFFLLARLLPALRERACWISVLAALLWGLMPIHVSASMMIVQRMTTLSASISLLGLIAYLLGRGGRFSPSISWLLIAGAMPACTLLAMAAKENAALLPFFCLLLERCLLHRDAPPLRGLLILSRLGVAMAVLAALVFFVVLLPHWQAGYGARDFSLTMRLWSEARIVTRYLRLIFLPSSSALSPFNDDYPLSSSFLAPAATTWAVCFLALLLLVAVALRKRWPVFTFAVFWFFLGHVLESTVVPLELYFDHRNYMPTLGFAFALVAGVFSLLPSYGRGVLCVFFAYLITMGCVLVKTAMVWGNPAQAAQIWSELHPNSERAIYFLAQRQLLAGDYRASFETFAAGSQRLPFNGGLLVATVHMACLSSVEAEALKPYWQRALANLPRSTFSFTASASMPTLVGLVSDGRCPGVTLDDALAMTDAMLLNPVYRNRGGAKVDLVRARATILLDEGRRDEAEQDFSRVLALAPNLGNLLFLAHLKAEMGKQEEAQSLLDYWYDRPPVRQELHTYWREEIHKDKARVAEIKPAGQKTIKP
jgi:protein O-mannosyl-transferase